MIRVSVNGYGTIGKRIADAILKQPDMKLVGVAKITPDYAAYMASRRGIDIYTTRERVKAFEEMGIRIAGTIEEMVEKSDVVVDATPGGRGKDYKKLYEKHRVKQVFQGGEKPDVADMSFSTLCNYNHALGKNSLRVVSCNTTGLLRAICAIRRIDKPVNIFAVIVRRGADPRETKRGPINAIRLDPPRMPSHHALDVNTVLPDVDIVTSAVVVPTTLMHVHIVRARMPSKPSIKDVIDAFENTPRILLVNSDYGFRSTAEVVEFFRDYGRKRYDIPELIIWEDSISIRDNYVAWIQAVHQESIVVPENIDAIRAVTNTATLEETLKITNTTLGLLKGRLFV